MNSIQSSSTGIQTFPQIFNTDAQIYIVKSTACCRRCGNLSPVATLAASPNTSELPEGEFCFFLFFHIERMPICVLDTLKFYSPFYKRFFDPQLRRSFYRNVCTSCNAVFADEDLSTDPGDAFNPCDESEYERIRIIDTEWSVGYELRIDVDKDYRSFGGIEASYGPERDMWDWHLNIQYE